MTTAVTRAPEREPVRELPRRAGGLPHELFLRDAAGGHGGAVRQVWVEADEVGVLADWDSQERVELMVAGRPFVLELDLDGQGVRLVEPMGRIPVAVFARQRVGGRVRLADGTVLRWLQPTRGSFDSGLVGHRDANIIRFAMDGTALVFAAIDLFNPPPRRPSRSQLPPWPLLSVSSRFARWPGRAPSAGSGDTCRGDLPDPRRGWLPDMLGLLVLGWFLRLLELRPALAADARSGDRHLGV
ncbi:hypothetical protein FAIPA1_20092 [Frankia sp. AiPs1]|uniref:hypothetical protein n=1 Tax=Frankia sp. AiPa1 TaxID=573492 RepID=UPI00202AC8B2|nr:hypothetical protein [Frankia sp. AiPa1]MCL9757975.1 hypothetical protein [Frankia sp. AiPa1]